MSILNQKNILRKFDWFLFFSMLLLITFGLTAMYGIDLSRNTNSLYYFKKQLIFSIIGFVAFFVASNLDFRVWKSYSKALYFLSIILLILVLFFGKNLRGTTGWFNFGLFTFQPIEAVKIFLLIFLSAYFSKKAPPLNKYKYIVFSFFSVLLIFLLTMQQPDLGSAVLLMLLWFSFILILSLNKTQILLLISAIILVSFVGWFYILEDYQKSRIEVFINPEKDMLGQGYNITQAIIAVGAGGLYGQGVSFGSQSQLKFLPESQTDFVFAVIAEEFGFVGAFCVLFLISFMLYRLSVIAREIDDDFATFLTINTLFLFFWQFFVNIAVNLGMGPITGITLPFVSYGGSSLVMSMFIIGIIQSIAIKR